MFRGWGGVGIGADECTSSHLPEQVVDGLLAAHQVVEGGVAHHPLHGGVPPAAQEVVDLPGTAFPEIGRQ